jgi:RecB family exonuclease
MPTYVDDVEVLREEREKTSASLLLADVEMASTFCELAQAADKVEVKEQRMAEAKRTFESVVNRLHLTRLTKLQRAFLSQKLGFVKLRIANTVYLR